MHPTPAGGIEYTDDRLNAFLDRMLTTADRTVFEWNLDRRPSSAGWSGIGGWPTCSIPVERVPDPVNAPDRQEKLAFAVTVRDEIGPRRFGSSPSRQQGRPTPVPLRGPQPALYRLERGTSATTVQSWEEVSAS